MEPKWAKRISVLIVGCEGIGKHRLGQGLTTDPETSISVKVTSSLSTITRDDYNNIDYVVFMVDLRNEQSWITAKTAIHQVDTLYFHGKACIVVLEVKKPHLFAFGVDQVEEMAEVLDIPTFFGSTEEAGELACLCSKLVITIGLNCGMCPSITPGLLMAGGYRAQNYNMDSTLERSTTVTSEQQD